MRVVPPLIFQLFRKKNFSNITQGAPQRATIIWEYFAVGLHFIQLFGTTLFPFSKNNIEF